MKISKDERGVKLAQAALGALAASYAPYSHFHVAAALLAEDGTVYIGNNIENASYPAGVCAERTAFFKAVGDGQRRFLAIAICGGKDGKAEDYCPPCGICRQVMREFCDPAEFKIFLAKQKGEIREYTLEELLPVSFGPDHVG